MNTLCQIEHGSSDSDVGMPCSNRAVATCSDFLGFRVLRNRRRDEGDEGTGESGGKNEHCSGDFKRGGETAKAENRIEDAR